MKRILVVAVVTAALASGCAKDGSPAQIQTVAPATAAMSPATAVAPAGIVEPTATQASKLVFDAKTGKLVTLAGGTVVVGKSTISGVTALFAANPGEIFVATGDRIERYDLATEKVVAKYPADGPALSAAVLSNGRVAVGTANGRVLVFDGDRVVARIGGFASVDTLVAVDNSLLALDVRQSMLIEVNIDEQTHGLALRTGQGAAQLATDHWSRVLVTDPRTRELTVYSANPLMMRQRIPTGSAPYAVTYDDMHEIACVTLTETNEVVGYDLSTGTAREVHRYPTVRQPNAIAVNPKTGELFVAGEGLQRIPA
ncbi:MAG: PQQ-like beta-propeller repeat protein [Nocardiaceae bacterium]|nr:PQQ-like beta-propeller repeat protein [Nocardiaceae bacterium]